MNVPCGTSCCRQQRQVAGVGEGGLCSTGSSPIGPDPEPDPGPGRMPRGLRGPPLPGSPRRTARPARPTPGPISPPGGPNRASTSPSRGHSSGAGTSRHRVLVLETLLGPPGTRRTGRRSPAALAGDHPPGGEGTAVADASRRRTRSACRSVPGAGSRRAASATVRSGHRARRGDQRLAGTCPPKTRCREVSGWRPRNRPSSIASRSSRATSSASDCGTR